MNRPELLVSRRDAERLAAVVGARRRAHALQADPSDALTDLLMDAHFVPHESLPVERVALHSSLPGRRGSRIRIHEVSAR